MFSDTAKTSGHSFTVDDVQELYYMTDMANLASILEEGILSHHRIERRNIVHADVSNHEVQGRRSDKYIERAMEGKKPLSLHEHVPLYLNPHNAMMHNSKDKNMCVLRISKAILQRKDAVLTNRNAATDAADFFTSAFFRLSPESTAMLVFGKSTHWEGDKEKRKQVRQAEVLLPYHVAPEFISGIIVRSEAKLSEASAIAASVERADLPIKINPSMFFDGPKFAPLACISPVAEFDIDGSALPESDSDDGIVRPSPIRLHRPATLIAPDARSSSAGGAGVIAEDTNP